MLPPEPPLLLARGGVARATGRYRHCVRSRAGIPTWSG